jgi:hypothetical protein
MSTPPSGAQLQAQLAAGSATAEVYAAGPHHPLACDGTLAVHEDGTLECPHGRTCAADMRTQMAIDQSIAYLLLECVHERKPSSDDHTSSG